MDKEINNSDVAGTLLSVEQTNHCAERAYWWMKGVDKEPLNASVSRIW